MFTAASWCFAIKFYSSNKYNGTEKVLLQSSTMWTVLQGNTARRREMQTSCCIVCCSLQGTAQVLKPSSQFLNPEWSKGRFSKQKQIHLFTMLYLCENKFVRAWNRERYDIIQSFCIHSAQTAKDNMLRGKPIRFGHVCLGQHHLCITLCWLDSILFLFYCIDIKW